MNIFNDITKITLPALEKEQVYIYILENYPQGNIKIGRTSDIKERVKSLSGSNSGGNYIVKCAVSEPTYLYSLERIMHMHFKEARIQGTEWFDGEKLSFADTVMYLHALMQSEEYQRCNELRKEFLHTENHLLLNEMEENEPEEEMELSA